MGLGEMHGTRCSLRDTVNLHGSDASERTGQHGLEGPSYLSLSMYQLGCLWLLVTGPSRKWLQ